MSSSYALKWKQLLALTLPSAFSEPMGWPSRLLYQVLHLPRSVWGAPGLAVVLGLGGGRMVRWGTLGAEGRKVQVSNVFSVPEVLDRIIFGLISCFLEYFSLLSKLFATNNNWLCISFALFWETKVTQKTKFKVILRRFCQGFLDETQLWWSWVILHEWWC